MPFYQGGDWLIAASPVLAFRLYEKACRVGMCLGQDFFSVVYEKSLP